MKETSEFLINLSFVWWMRETTKRQIEKLSKLKIQVKDFHVGYLEIKNIMSKK